MKSEPFCYSIDDLKMQKRGMWDGVRNYQARNHLRSMKNGDRALFYHSSAEVIGVVGLMKIVRAAYPDPTQFDRTADHYDPKSTNENPRWSVVDVAFEEKFKSPITLAVLKNDPRFKDMLVTQTGSRLSVQPVSKKHFDAIITLTKNI